MKLYTNGFAPSPRRVRMFAAEKGIALTLIELDISKGETQTPAYRQVNPVGETPVLELDDGTRISESLAICRYLEALQPEPNLMGSTPLERAQIEAQALQLLFRVYVPSTQAFRHTHKFWADRIQQVPEYGVLAREQVLAEWRRIDALLGTRAFIAGDRFSVADIVAFTTLAFGKPSGIRVQPEQSNLARWYDVIAARPSAKA